MLMILFNAKFTTKARKITIEPSRMEIKIQDISYLHGNVDMYLKFIIASALDVIPIKHHGKERANDKNIPTF